MAVRKKAEKEEAQGALHDFANELISDLNKQHKKRIAYNLGSDISPTHVTDWISTGSTQLDYDIANKPGGGFPVGRIVEIFGPPCHAKGDKVLRYDGTLVAVEDVKVGDQLLGPDGTPRNVVECHNGTEELYKITPNRGGNSMVVNQYHKLFLQHVRTAEEVEAGVEPRTIEMPVREYIQQTNNFKKMWKQVRVSIDLFEGNQQGKRTVEDCEIPPYVVGLLLGDGFIRNHRVELTTADKEIENAYKGFLEETYGYETSYHTKKDNAAVGIYHRSGVNLGRALNEGEEDHDRFRRELSRLGLIGTSSGNKFIPDEYKFGSRQVRLELLAGLIDTDGNVTGGSRKSLFEITSKSRRLAEDIQFVANSLGFFASLNAKPVNGTDYFRVHIGGNNLWQIPTRVPRKQMVEAKTNRVNHNLFGFAVEHVGQDEYFGFEVDVDHHYLFNDFSRLVNSIGKSHLAAQICKATQAKGGIAILIDAENATNPENLGALGVDIKKGFVYIDVSCTEEILEIAESTMIKARALIPDKPVVIIWDSVAASSPKAELEGEYEKNTIGLQARVLSKGMRKITHIIGENKALLVCINQMRMDINAGPYGDPWCVDPYRTMINWRINSPKLVPVAEKVLGKDCKYNLRTSLHDMARYIDAVLGTDITDAYNENGTLPECYNPEAVFGDRPDGSSFDANEPLEFFDVQDAYIEVEGPAGYVRVNGFTVKPPVNEHYYLEKYNFYGTGSHRVKVGDNWVPLCEHSDAVKVSKPMSVVDITTETGIYMAHGLVHHNTTPGGNAIPFHASVRVRLNSGKQLQNKDGEIVGIKVISHVKKNKVGYPFRKSEFEIHFGKGIVEHEQLFDVLRAAGPQTLDDGTVISIEGTGAWKSLIVNDPTGEVVVEKKFYKAEFGEIWKGLEFGHWVDKACERALVKTTQQLETMMAVSKANGETEDDAELSE